MKELGNAATLKSKLFDTLMIFACCLTLAIRAGFGLLEKVVGGSFIRCRLDGALVSTDWMVRFPAISLTHLTVATSDHAPLLVEFGTHKELHKKHTFKYELMWETHEGLRDMLLAGWDPGMPCTTVDEMRIKLRISHRVWASGAMKLSAVSARRLRS